MTASRHWRSILTGIRGRLLYKPGDLVAANAEKLGELEVRDNGKLLAEMQGQMRYLPEWFYYDGGLADKTEGSVTPAERPGMMHFIRYEPIGIVAAISPWNLPLVLTVWKLAPALAAGNTKERLPEFSPLRDRLAWPGRACLIAPVFSTLPPNLKIMPVGKLIQRS